MESSNDKNYSWEEALEMINKGWKMRLPEWKGYWFKYKEENGIDINSPIYAITKDGDIVYAWQDDYYKTRTDWQVAYGLGFDWALSALKAGKTVRRKEWNNAKMYLWLMLPAQVPIDWIKEPGLKKAAEMNGGSIFCEPAIRIYTAQNTVSTGWRPTNLDMFAEDWELADY